MAKVTDPELIRQLESMSAQPQPPAQQASMGLGEMMGRAVENIPGSAKNFASNIVQPIVHPIQTAEGIAALLSGDEHAVQGLKDFIVQRYGGLENVKRTFAEDPVGFAADAALILSGGGALMRGAGKAGQVSGLVKAGEAVGKAGKMVDPISGTATAVGKAYGAASKAVPALAPEKLVMSTLKKAPLSSKLTAEQQAANASTALEHGIDVGSRSGLEKLWSKMDEMDAAIGQTIDDLAAAGDTVPKKKLFDSVREMKFGEKSPWNVHPDRDIFHKAINQQIINTAKRFPGNSVPVKAVHQLKINLQTTVRKLYGQRGNVRAEAQKALAHDARQVLADKYPELAALNKTDAALHQLEKALEGAVTRIEARDLLGFGMTSKLGAGTAIGLMTGDMMTTGAGATMGLIVGLLDTPAVKGKLALALDKARKRTMMSRNPKAYVTRESAYRSGQLSDMEPANGTQR